MRRILFVCGAGVDRSPAAAMWARHLASQEGVEIEASSFGLYHPTASALRSKGAFDQYDRIFVMERGMEGDVREGHAYNGDIVCLDVEDRDDWTERELSEVFERVFADEGLRRKVLYSEKDLNSNIP